jgi:type II secretory pathway component GspD/PulD (secretin)
VRDGETIAIGGLTLQQEFKTKSKIPLLGDIPGLGELFTSHSKTKVNSELVIFITPHILTDRGRLSDEATEQSLRERFLGKEAEGEAGEAEPGPQEGAPEEGVEGEAGEVEPGAQEGAPAEGQGNETGGQEN